jgi:hypothetical protein
MASKTLYSIAALIALVSPSVAQTPVPGDLLNQLVANAAQYRVTIPSLTADESIDSESSYGGLFKRKVQANGTFRAVRGTPGEPLKESRQVTELNGRPVSPNDPVRLPVALFGGFGRFQEMFFTPEHVRCFAFTLLPDPGPRGTLQIAISAAQNLDSQPGCPSGYKGLTGVALVDVASHQLVHVERTLADSPANRGSAPFASVDSAPTKVGEETFWLPTEVAGGTPKQFHRGKFVAHYSNYHRYVASVTLLPGTAEVDPAVELPAGQPPASTPR